MIRGCLKFGRKINPSFKCLCTFSSDPVPLRSLKPKSTKRRAVEFVDVRNVRAVAGNGGDGCISFLQLWANETAGPDGGDGGSGGHVVIQACQNVKGLNGVSSILRGENGEKGYNKDCCGKNAPHTIVKVPVGTIVKDRSGKLLGDLEEEGMMFVLARGGSGGHGNAFFATDQQQSPNVAEYGALGEDMSYTLEIKSMAHFGLVGFPNAGKSSLLQAISRAKPKVAPYPFTTLKPHIGMVPYSDYSQIAVADLPGLIEDSHKNRGLGIDFLRHIERCTAVILVVDLTNDPIDHVTVLRKEITLFSKEVSNKAQLIVANKIDLPDTKENLEELIRAFPKEEIISVSAKYGTNITKLLSRLKNIYDVTLSKMSS